MGRQQRLAMALGCYASRPTRQTGPVPMDVDAIRTESLSKEERQKLMKEGRCFHCKKQGHMSRLCPQKKKKASDDGKAKTCAVARVVEEEEGEPKKDEELTKEQLKKGLKRLTDEDKDVLIKELLADSPDSATSDF
jgi:hypothetical protein